MKNQEPFDSAAPPLVDSELKSLLRQVTAVDPPPELLDRILADIPRELPSFSHRGRFDHADVVQSEALPVWRRQTTWLLAAGVLITLFSGALALRWRPVGTLPDMAVLAEGGSPGDNEVAIGEAAALGGRSVDELRGKLQDEEKREDRESAQEALRQQRLSSSVEVAVAAPAAPAGQSTVPLDVSLSEAESRDMDSGLGRARDGRAGRFSDEFEGKSKELPPPMATTPAEPTPALGLVAGGVRGSRRNAAVGSEDGKPRQPASSIDPLPNTNPVTVQERPLLDRRRVEEVVATSEFISVAPPAMKKVAANSAASADRSGRPRRELADEDVRRSADLEAAELEAAWDSQPWTETSRQSRSTFALDVDTASYTVLRGHLQSGNWPPAAQLRLEEVLNYFDFGDPAPRRQDFAMTAEAIRLTGGNSFFWEPPAQTERRPAGADRLLVRFGLRARDLSGPRPPTTLIFLVDTSGSMSSQGRLEMVRGALRFLLRELESGDEVGLVAYNTVATALSEPTRDLRSLDSALARLQAGGSTNLDAGMVEAYRMAAQVDSERRVRIVLASDGIANVGETQARPLLGKVADWAARGVELTTVGVGMGDFNDALLEQLADSGDGRYVYIDSQKAAEKVFREELDGTLTTIAREARAQVAFDPEQVESYRLLGYQNRRMPNQAFRSTTVDAGEVGAGHRVTVLYEVVLRGAARLGGRHAADELATLTLRWRPAEERQRAGRSAERAFSDDSWQESSVSLRGRDVRGPMDGAPAVRMAAVIAEFVGELRSPRPSVRRLESLADQAQGLLSAFPGNRDLVELTLLISEAARLAG